MHIRMKRDFHVPISDEGVKTYPAGWVGDAPDEHAEAALAAGAADDTGRSPAGAPEGDAPDNLEKLSRADLDALAAERGVDITSASNKGDVIELLRAA